MAESRLQTAIYQTLTISAIGLLIQNSIIAETFSYAANSTLASNVTQAVVWFANSTLNETLPSNITLNGTDPTTAQKTSSPNAFAAFWISFVRPLIITTLLVPLQYHWQLWLEKMFPSRPPVYIVIPDEKRGDAEGGKKEKVVLTEASMHRTPLSFGNMFFKWSVDMTVGTFWRRGASLLLDDVVLGLSIDRLRPENLFWTFMNIVIQCIFSWFSFRPLASMLSFVLIPAHKRVVFMVGFEVLWSILVALFFRSIFPWFENLEVVQAIMNNVTAEMNKQDGGITPDEARLIDEL